jgi:hypothetical protein
MNPGKKLKQPRKKPARRAFSGLAGSPLAELTKILPVEKAGVPGTETVQEVVVEILIRDHERRKRRRKKS